MSAARIPLFGGEYALVDEEDALLVSAHRWRKHPSRASVYAISYIAGKNVLMHRLLMTPPDGFVTDHINRNGLDNTRANLRFCTVAENARNRPRISRSGASTFKGVSVFRPEGKWRATIRHNGKDHYLGRFSTEIEAARAYDTAAKQFFGPFAFLNFPEQSTSSVQVLSCTGDESQCRPTTTLNGLIGAQT